MYNKLFVFITISLIYQGAYESAPMPSKDPIQIYSLLVNAGLAVATILFMFLTHRANKKKSEIEGKLEAAHEYVKNLDIIDYTYQDIVFLGPRDSGKTSVAKLWTQPAFNIDGLPATKEWKSYERDIVEVENSHYKNRHPTLQVELNHHKRLRIRVHDYPGEDEFRLQAISKLPELQNSVLLLFFNVNADSTGILKISDNNRYYSQAFMDSVKQQNSLTLKISKVIVVFNKADLLSPTVSPYSRLDSLKKVNGDAIERIESLFSGKLTYMLISAKDNRGLITLLGASGSPMLPEAVKKSFDEKLRQLVLEEANQPV